MKKTTVEETYKVTLESGIEINCSTSHKFFITKNDVLLANELTTESQV